MTSKGCPAKKPNMVGGNTDQVVGIIDENNTANDVRFSLAVDAMINYLLPDENDTTDYALQKKIYGAGLSIVSKMFYEKARGIPQLDTSESVKDYFRGNRSHKMSITINSKDKIVPKGLIDVENIDMIAKVKDVFKTMLVEDNDDISELEITHNSHNFMRIEKYRKDDGTWGFLWMLYDDEGAITRDDIDRIMEDDNDYDSRQLMFYFYDIIDTIDNMNKGGKPKPKLSLYKRVCKNKYSLQ
jgi:hypothetical protein